MKKLAVIVPYNEKLIENFTDHFSAVVKKEDFYYKIFFIKQKSNRPLNKGKLFNIGFSLVIVQTNSRFVYMKKYYLSNLVNTIPLKIWVISM